MNFVQSPLIFIVKGNLIILSSGFRRDYLLWFVDNLWFWKISFIINKLLLIEARSEWLLEPVYWFGYWSSVIRFLWARPVSLNLFLFPVGILSLVKLIRRSI